jgi:hypothetical protein
MVANAYRVAALSFGSLSEESFRRGPLKRRAHFFFQTLFCIRRWSGVVPSKNAMAWRALETTYKTFFIKVVVRERELLNGISRILNLSGGKTPNSKVTLRYRKDDLTGSERESRSAWVKAHLNGGVTLDELKASLALR